MPHWFRIRLILSNLLFTLALSALASDRKYEGDVYFTIRDGAPCFYVEGTQKDREVSGAYLGVTGRKGLVWEMYKDNGTDLLPISKALCVKYGVAWRGAQVSIPMQPLQDEVQYSVLITSGKGWEGAFCMKHVNGILTLRQFRQGSCSDDPVYDPDHPTLWQRIFGP